jgi:hypothetical protein
MKSDDTRSDPEEALSWLQGWYMAHCDGEWEHAYGVTIESADDGWTVEIELTGTELQSRSFRSVATRWGGDDDWMRASLDSAVWRATCGPESLTQCVTEFRHWAQTQYGDREVGP